MQFAKIIPGLEADHDTLVLKVLEFNHLWHQKCNPTHWQKNEVFKTVISKEKHIKHIKHLYTAQTSLGQQFCKASSGKIVWTLQEIRRKSSTCAQNMVQKL
jgi:hypothetical protein